MAQSHKGCDIQGEVFCVQDVGLSEVSLEKFMGRTVELLEIMAQAS